MTNWYSLSIAKIVHKLDIAKAGLTQQEAEKRLVQFGPNSLREEEKTSLAKLFFSQFANLLIVILLTAVGISFLLGEFLDAIIILVVVFFSAILGFIQEYRSQKALSALKKLASQTAHVIRNGQQKKINADQLVPGDFIILHWGDKVPADARLIEELDLEVSEAILTGESMPVKKNIKVLSDRQLPLAERLNMVYSGTIITRGHGQAIVVATGMNTEFGKIAYLLKTVEEEQTPLEKKLDNISRYLGFGSLIVCALATLLGIFRGYPILQMFIWGVSLAVAAVPESLPAVVTGSLSLGVWEMAKQKAIVRRLPAVETLGSINVICSDKTGTLTKNEMTVREVFVNDKTIFVEGTGYQPQGGFLLKKGFYDYKKDKELKELIKIGLFCNDAVLIQKGKDWLIDGDPTEGALVVLAAKAGLDKKEKRQEYPRLAEIPFEMERKRMSTLHTINDKYHLLVKGAPESVLSQCQYIQINREIKKLNKEEIAKILKQTNQMAKNAMRVLGFAYRTINKSEINLKNNKLTAEKWENNLIFVGLAGMIDPPREEAKQAIKQCRESGIRPIIITGDHALTTFAIGKEIGLFKKESDILTSEQLNKLSYNEFLDIVDKKSYARASPEDKLRIIKALKEKGYIVAMTGDGVNDAPALKKADIGIAMGLTGTDVAKETADLVLADDNFATIIVAIKKGREIYDNIKKYLFYLLRCNIGEVLVLGGGFLFGLPPILSAIQILWVNLVTDGLPALALGIDPPDKNIMKRDSADSNKGIFSTKSVILMFLLAGNMALVLLPQFAFYAKSYQLIKVQTFVFITMVMMEMMNSYNSRSDQSIFTINPLANKWLNLAVASSIIATILIVQVPQLSYLFGTSSLTIKEWFIALLLSSSTLFFAEIGKVFLDKIKI